MLVTQAFRFELDPNNRVRAALISHAGATRFVYNWGLDLVGQRVNARRALAVLAIRQGASVAEAEAWATGLAGAVPWTLPALRREWNQAKSAVAPWWAENSKEAYSSGLDALSRAFKAFFDSRSGTRRGRRVGWPRLKRRGRARRSFRVTTGGFGVVDSRHVRLPRIGVIRTKESTTSLLARIETPDARILSVTVSEQGGRWFASFTTRVERHDAPRSASGPVGVDVGVKHLAVLSTGEVVANPRHLSRYERRLTRLQRQLARRHGPIKGARGSNRWQATKARLARTHRRAANARADGLHKLTTRLAKSHTVVVIEDLNVVGLTAAASRRSRSKAGLNRALLDVAPDELRRQLGYKTVWYGSALVVADRWYPSSKTCSRCKTVKAKLSLAERVFGCEHCGLVLDRDLNAAINLASLAEGTNVGTASGAGTSRAASRRNA
jgi:putative transposase